MVTTVSCDSEASWDQQKLSKRVCAWLPIQYPVLSPYVFGAVSQSWGAVCQAAVLVLPQIKLAALTLRIFFSQHYPPYSDRCH